jgi:prepilin-type processing-associated H-X9-DG protein
MANLRNLAQALVMYTNETGYYPNAAWYDQLGEDRYATWPTLLRQYLGANRDVFLCPSRDARFAWTAAMTGPEASKEYLGFGYEAGEHLLRFGDTPFSYGYNAWGADTHGDIYTGLCSGSEIGIRAQYVKLPTEMIALGDSAGDGFVDLAIWPVESTPTFPPSIWIYHVGNIHFGGSNVAFCDAHIEWHLQKELSFPLDDGPFGTASWPMRIMWNRGHDIP